MTAVDVSTLDLLDPELWRTRRHATVGPNILAPAARSFGLASDPR